MATGALLQGVKASVKASPFVALAFDSVVSLHPVQGRSMQVRQARPRGRLARAAPLAPGGG